MSGVEERRRKFNPNNLQGETRSIPQTLVLDMTSVAWDRADLTRLT